MSTILCYLYFLILTGIGFYLLYKPSGIISMPFDHSRKMRCTGTELLIIFIFATGLIGLIPVLAIRLAVLELLCIIGIFRSEHKAVFSVPMILFGLFISWEIIGLSYTPSKTYGIRMILKYIYPFLLALFTSAVVRDKEIFLKAALSARWTAALSISIYFIPGIALLFTEVFWNRAALATHYISLCIFSLGMLYVSNKKIKNLFWTILFILPCFIWVFRTDIMGSAVAISTFFLIKYRIKSLPFIVIIAIFAVCSIFYIPSVKKKMYFRPDEVTVADFLSGNVDENNINTSGRKAGWEDVENWFYKGHELVGSGTGRVQTYFYTEAVGWRRGGQLHNDFLVLMCDNGLIGLALFILSYVAILLHCTVIYRRSRSNAIKMCALIAGSSLWGVFVTMYSDNTLAYSMATLSYPWGFYGMTLGMQAKEKRFK